MATVEDVLKVARSQIGIKEDPPNSNKVKYNAWYYGADVIGSQYPWCAVFVSWVFNQVDKKLIKSSASCMEIGNWFKANGKFKKTDPNPGDVVFFKFSTNSRWANHIGIVEAVNSDGSITTIEGNTSASSNDNGGCVMRRKRKTNIVGFGTVGYTENKGYFPKCAENHISFVDALKSIGANYSLQYRKKIALANGFVEYKATAEQNMVLLNKLKMGKLVKPN